MVEWYECLSEATQGFLTVFLGIFIVVGFFYGIALVFERGMRDWLMGSKKCWITALPAVMVWGFIVYWIITSIINMITCI